MALGARQVSVRVSLSKSRWLERSRAKLAIEHLPLLSQPGAERRELLVDPREKVIGFCGLFWG